MTQFVTDVEMQEKEDWINAIGRSIVRHSKSVTDDEVLDYDSKQSGGTGREWLTVKRQTKFRTLKADILNYPGTQQPNSRFWKVPGISMWLILKRINASYFSE